MHGFRFGRGKGLRSHTGNLNQILTEILEWSEAWKWPVMGTSLPGLDLQPLATATGYFLQEGSFVKGTPFSSGLPEPQDDVKDG